jgi:hypothetical protein
MCDAKCLPEPVDLRSPKRHDVLGERIGQLETNNTDGKSRA